MSALLRGLDEGLRTGVQLGNILRQGQQRRALADESARFNVTEGAYGSELDQNVEQVQGLMRQAQQQAAAQGGTVEDMTRIEREYMPAIEELQRRSQMTAPDFSIASGPQTFGTREEATRAARPMRAEGLASVYERFGDIDQAESLRERADAGRARELQMRGLERTEREAEGMQMAQQLIMGQEQAGAPITADFLRVVATQTGANYNAVVDSAAKAIGFKEASATATLNDLKRDLNKAATTGVSGLNKFLADRFDPDETDDIKPEVTKDARGNFVVTYGGQVLPQYGASRSLEELVARTQGNIDGDPLGTVKTLLDIDLRRAQIKESEAKTAAAGRSGLQRKVDDFKELYGRDPTDDEKAILVGLQGRPGAARVPTAADINSRARMYLDNDQTNTLTVQEATALAERDFGLREGPTNQRASLVDQAISGPAATAPRATATPAGQQLLGLYNTLVPPEQRPAIPRPGPTTSQERLQQFYR
jgi:hypothetical protein